MSTCSVPRSSCVWVFKRDGRRVDFDFDKLKRRFWRVIRVDERSKVEADKILASLCRGLKYEVVSDRLEVMLSDVTAQHSILHPVHEQIAGRIAAGRLHKLAPASFSASVAKLSTEPHNVLDPDFVAIVNMHGLILDDAIDHSKDLEYSWSAIKVFEKSYLLKGGDTIAERPQHMFMRVAVALHGLDVGAVLDTYKLLSDGYYVHASPTYFHAGTRRGQLSSCFLLPLDTSTATSPYRTLVECADITHGGGGIGLNINEFPSLGEPHSTQLSPGIIPLLRLFDSSIALTDQGDNKRPGAIAVYIEPWHADISSFLDMRRIRGDETQKARRLFYALWIPDIFMRRIQSNQPWSLFRPGDVPELEATYGSKFTRLYEAAERSGRAKRTVSAKLLWTQILQTQIETGGPFMLYKDAVNLKNNQRNLGVITHSNLCTEIVQHSSSNETAVCNLASLILPSYINASNEFDYELLHQTMKHVVVNLNKLIHVTRYPSAKAAESNHRHRALGIGFQGLADVFQKLKLPFDSLAARAVSTRISATMYHAALEASCELVSVYGPYPSFQGSPLANGELQYDLWNVPGDDEFYDWRPLKQRIRANGTANSLLIALMPTAGTSQFTGCSECFEPIPSNLFSRRVLSGEFMVLSRLLIAELESRGLWTEGVRHQIMSARGSVKYLPGLPDNIKAVFKTAWEVDPLAVIKMAAARGPYVCQSQSMSIYLEHADIATLTKLHFTVWNEGLKTGMYYLRTKGAAEAIPFTLPARNLEGNEQPQDSTTLDGATSPNSDSDCSSFSSQTQCLSCTS